jgi:predicted SprT family Zn-dependent metalloprotease
LASTDRIKQEASQNVTQLALPGLTFERAPEPFDVIRLVKDTFTRHAPGAAAPGIKISRRMSRTLGSFTPVKNLIRLSSRLLALGSTVEQRQVALHEVAHAIVHHRDPKASAHGREFRTVCRELGLEPARFVNIDHEQWKDRLRYASKCPGCGETLLRKKRSWRVRCECGVAVRPKAWAAVAVTDSGVKPL